MSPNQMRALRGLAVETIRQILSSPETPPSLRLLAAVTVLNTTTDQDPGPEPAAPHRPATILPFPAQTAGARSRMRDEAVAALSRTASTSPQLSHAA